MLRNRGQAVWVDLRALFPPAPATSSAVEDGLIVDSVVPGSLQRWERTANGDWVGVVTVLLQRADGTTYKASEQLVPADALRPR